MSRKVIPWAILHLNDEAWGAKMDQLWLLNQFETDDRFEQVTDTEAIIGGGILVLQGNGHQEYADTIRRTLKNMPWAVLVVMSDECAEFPWHKMSLGQNIRYAAQLPQRRIAYPKDTLFFGEMPGLYRNPNPKPVLERSIPISFRGQVQNERREQCVEALREIPGAAVTTTGGFMQGDREAYLAEIEDSMFVACPAGNCTQSTFRAFEALEAGAIPLVDAEAPHQPNPRYWERIGMEWLTQIFHWSDLPNDIDFWTGEPEIVAYQMDVMDQWAFYKKALIDKFVAQARAAEQGFE